MKEIKIPTIKIIVYQFTQGTDLISIYSNLPPGMPKSSQQPLTLNMNVAHGTGAEYIEKNFGIKAEVVQA